MKRIFWFILTAALLLTACLPAAFCAADGEHPITLTVTCEEPPELEGEGEIPDLLFTIRNDSQTDYTMTDAVLSGGYADKEMEIDDTITVPAGGTREFHLYDVPVRDDQLNKETVYTLRWEETVATFDEETGEATLASFPRETSASFMIERFVVPRLSVDVIVDYERVRQNESFTVTYIITNATEYDMSRLKLSDTMQSHQSIDLPSTDIKAGETMRVPVTYQMGSNDMSFLPRVDYIARRRELSETREQAVTVQSVVVDLALSVQAYPATKEGTTFSITVTNNGSHTMTGIRIYDEINTPVEDAFDLAPGQTVSRLFTVTPAVSSDYIRTVRFHVTARDTLGKQVRVDGTDSFDVVPYVESSNVRLSLIASLQTPYIDENGKLCVTVQFEIRNFGDVRIHSAVLKELGIFGEVKDFGELPRGVTYHSETYQIDNVSELSFRLDALDPANQPRTTDVVRISVAGLRESIAVKTEPEIVVSTFNPYLQDLDTKYTGVLKTILIVGLSIAGVCALICIILLSVEIGIRNKLPADFEEDMENALRATKRRTEKQLFSDAPTEQFGYTAPVKLRSYGELTEAEAKARRESYAKGLEENLRREGVAPQPKPVSRTPVMIDGDGTRVLPVSGRTATAQSAGTVNRPAPQDPNAAHRPASGTGEFKRPAAQPNRPIDETAAYKRPAAQAPNRPVDETSAFKRPAAQQPNRPTDETAADKRPAAQNPDAVQRPVSSTGEFKRPAAQASNRPTDETAAYKRPAAQAPNRPIDETASYKRPAAPAPEKVGPKRSEVPRSFYQYEKPNHAPKTIDASEDTAAIVAHAENTIEATGKTAAKAPAFVPVFVPLARASSLGGEASAEPRSTHPAHEDRGEAERKAAGNVVPDASTEPLAGDVVPDVPQEPEAEHISVDLPTPAEAAVIPDPEIRTEPLAGDVVPDASTEPESEPVSDDLPSPAEAAVIPDPEIRTEPLAGDVETDVPQEAESEPSTEMQTSPAEAEDIPESDVPQEAEAEPASDMQTVPAETEEISVSDVLPEPEPEPVSVMQTSPAEAEENTDPEIRTEPLAGDAVPDAPTESELETSAELQTSPAEAEENPDPDVPKEPEADAASELPSAVDVPSDLSSDPADTIQQAAAGPRQFDHVPQPTRRSARYQTIKRMNG